MNLVQNTDKLARAEHFQGQNDVHFAFMTRRRMNVSNVDLLFLHQLGNLKQEAGAVIHVNLNRYQAHLARCRTFAPAKFERPAW